MSLKSKISLLGAASVLAFAVNGGVAFAADPEPVEEGCNAVKLDLSGQVNQFVLYADNSESDDIFIGVDNDNSSTRVRWVGERDFDCDLKVGAQIEVQIESNTSPNISFGQDTDEIATPINGFNERKLEVYLKSKTFGDLWLGQGDPFSNGAAEITQAGAQIISYGSFVDINGGLEFENGVELNQSSNSFDGITRTDRIRYDTPNFFGFKAGASYTQDNSWDVGVRYKRQHGDFKIASVIAYADFDTFEAPGAQGADETLTGTFSVLHSSGLNFTVVGALGFDLNGASSGRLDPTGGADRNSEFIYGQIGWRTNDIFDFGETAFVADYGFQSDFGAEGDERQTAQIGVLQNINKIKTELYGSVRVDFLDVDDPANIGNEFLFGEDLPGGDSTPVLANAVDPDAVVSVIVGARVKF